MGLLLSQGLSMTLLLASLKGVLVSSLEKSPCRSAAVGTVLVTVDPCVWRYCSHEKKKNVLSRPS
jgi:hypothetical protein